MLDKSGFDSRRDIFSFAREHTGFGADLTDVFVDTEALFPGLQQPEHGADHASPFILEVKECTLM